jgi:hypothetical protein
MSSNWIANPTDTSEFNINNTFFEPVKVASIKKIIDSGWNKIYTDKKWLEEFHVPYNSGREHLHKILKKIKHGELETKCVLSESQIGRAYYKGYISLAALPRELRQALSVENMVDYDMENAQPNILLSICEAENIPTKEYQYLRSYCKKREEMLKKVCEDIFGKDSFKENREKIKLLFIRVCLFQGSMKKWCDDVKIPFLEHDIINCLKKEIKLITENYIIKHNAYWYNQIKKDIEDNKKDKSVLSSIASRFLQHHERLIVEHILKHLNDENYITRNRFMYCYDGFQIQAKVPLEKLHKWTKDIGYNINWTIKLPKEGKQLLEDVEKLYKERKNGKQHPTDKLKIFNLEYLKSMEGDYELMKDYFERFYCFTFIPEPVYWLKTMKQFKCNRTEKVKYKQVIIPYTEEKVRKSYKHIVSGVLKNGAPEFFISKWINDPNKKTKNNMEFFPCNKKELNDDTTFFNSFTGYNPIVFDKVNYNENILKGFKFIARNLLGNEQAYNEFIHIVAHNIKYPSKKLPYGIIMKSMEGEGKNTILDCAGRIIGDAHYTTTSNIRDIVGDHAEGMFHKLIVNLNEMDLASTKDKGNRFKALITEDKLIINIKNIRPVETDNFALYVITTNENCPIKLDIINGERRWFVFEGNKKNLQLSQNQWTNLHNLFESDIFIQQLYTYLMNLDVEKYDFKQAKQNNSMSKAYNRVASYYCPSEILFLKDFIMERKYTKYIQEGIVCHDIPESMYYDYDDFYKEQEIECKYLTNDFWDWATENKFSFGRDKSTKSFNNKMMNLKLNNFEKKLHSLTRRAVFVFQPSNLLFELIDKKYVDGEVKNWKNEWQNTKKNKKNNTVTDEMLGF